MDKFVTIQEAARLTNKSTRTIQRRFDKAKKKANEGEEPLYKYQMSEKGGRVKLFSVSWLALEFSNEVKSQAGGRIVNESQSETLSVELREVLEREREELVNDKRVLQAQIEKLTESLQLEQRKVAQLEFERIQLLESGGGPGLAKDKGKLSNLSMSEWWDQQQAGAGSDEVTVEEVIVQPNEDNDETTELQARQIERPTTFSDWLKSAGSKS